MPNPEKKNARIYAILDHMSTQALEEMLRLDSQMPDRDDSDMGQILYIMEVLARREKERPSGRFTGVDAAWESFNQNYRPYAEDENPLFMDEGEEKDETRPTGIAQSPSAATPKASVRRPPTRRTLRAARLTAAVLAVLLGCMVVAQAFGFDVFGAIARWTEETFRFGVSSQTGEEQAGGDDQTGEDMEYATLQEALDAYGITEPVAPAWIPDGFALGGIDVDSLPDSLKIHATYQAGEQHFAITLSLYDSVEQVAAATFEKDMTNVLIHEINGISHYLISNNDWSVATWTNGLLVCSISGDQTVEDLTRMIDSIYR